MIDMVNCRSTLISIACLFIFAVPALGRCDLPKDKGASESRLTVQELVRCLGEQPSPLDRHFSVQRRVIFELHRRGKEAIPSLIDNISNTKKVNAFLGNPRSSIGAGSTAPAGKISAYVVELILGRETLLGSEVPDNIGVVGDNSKNYVYWEGLILNDRNEPTTAEDLPAIQQLYRDWWEKNRDEPLAVLRERWKNKQRVLDGKKYRWK